ncbi:MAG TPA: 3-deoxy-D-manno-octulosonic acid transferase [Vicinamibacterales bacterium]|nr:3-deoxy-D-manno-octulosonic acid transferase [Vicinamibacterales bacterium]
MYFLYSVLALAFFVAVSPWFLYQAIRYRKYIGSVSQRMGYLPVSFNMDGEQSIWIHAVSVGEVLSARPLVRDLRIRYPRHRIFLSTTTMTGQAIARRSVQDADGVFYFPFDLGLFVRRTLDVVRPRLFVMMETEIWPHLLRECRRRGIRTAIVNGRLSQRSYPRYRLVRGFMRTVLDDVDRFCVQSEQSARRFIDLGANPGRITVTGSLKFDSLELPAPALQSRARDRVLRYFRMPASRFVVVAGSTMKGEEAAVLVAFRRVRSAAPNTLLILAPRHVERVSDVEQLCRQEGFKTVRRSDLPIDAEPRVDVVVLDTIGELATIYQLATVAFVGGSLVDTGGHNILEPAVFGKPIVFGPYMSNFGEIADAFLANIAGIQVKGERELADVLVALMTDPVRRARLGAAARALVEANRGAKDKSIAVLTALLPPDKTTTYPANVRPFRPIA